MNMMILVWLAVIIVFGIAEAATVNLVSIWFAIGAVFSLIAVVFNASIPLQIILFIVVSIVLLILTAPLVKKYLKKTITPTNADRALGQEAKVIDRIDNDNFTGAVYIDGKTWTARSVLGTIIEADSFVIVERIEGVKLYVKEKKMEE